MPSVLVSSSTSISSRADAPSSRADRTCWRIPGSYRCVAAASTATRTNSRTFGSRARRRAGTAAQFRYARRKLASSSRIRSQASSHAPCTWMNSSLMSSWACVSAMWPTPPGLARAGPLLLPQPLAGQGCSLGHGGELRPDDLGMADPRPDAAVGPRLHVLPAYHAGEIHQPCRHQLGMLDEVCRVAD